MWWGVENGVRGCADGRSADLQQVDLENEGLIWPDETACSAWAVGEVRRDKELDFSTLLEELEPLGPAGDDAIEGKLDWLIVLVGTVELGAVDERAAVVHLHGIGGLG